MERRFNKKKLDGTLGPEAWWHNDTDYNHDTYWPLHRKLLHYERDYLWIVIHQCFLPFFEKKNLKFHDNFLAQTTQRVFRQKHSASKEK